MTPITDRLLQELVAGSHAQSAIATQVTCVVDHNDRLLLILEPRCDLIDGTWQLPTGPVLPGDTLTDALTRTLAEFGLDLEVVAGYLGHHDRAGHHGELIRVFCFAVTLTRPDRVCRYARISHWWASFDELPDLPTPPELCRTSAQATTTVSHPNHDDPSLAGALRTSACGLRAAQAGTELLISHATWLHHSDFCDRFVHLDTSLTDDTDIAIIDWPAAITALDTAELACSSGEARILRIAASLIAGTPVNLGEVLVGLDSRNLDLVGQALLHISTR